MKQRYRFNPLAELIRLIYPSTCCACGTALVGEEQNLCSHCLLHLPLAHLTPHADNFVERHYIGRVPIKNATTLLVFRKDNITQHIVHEIKYYGNRKLAVQMGRMLGAEINDCQRFASVDYLVPVPLHRRRKWQRGYNQSEKICEGIAEVFQRPIITKNLVRDKYTDSQTRRDRISRMDNMSEVFAVRNPEELENKHILIVDDVITSGATIESCWIALSSIPGITVSVASVSMAGIG